MKSGLSKKIVMSVFLIVVALISIFGVTKIATSTEHHAATIEKLDEKRMTVLKLTAATTAASTAISAIPGDAGTPIANKIADLSSYLLVVLCAVFLEKYLLTVMGYAAFNVLIPAACLLGVFYIFTNHQVAKMIAAKMAIVGLALYLIVPVSVKVSNLIENTYQDSIATTIDEANQATDEIESSTAEETTDAETETEAKENIVSNIFNTVTGGVSSAVTTVTDAATKAISNAEQTLNNFIEAIAVMIVTSCLIPIGVLLFFFWLIKTVLGINMDLPKVPKHGERIGEKQEIVEQ